MMLFNVVFTCKLDCSVDLIELKNIIPRGNVKNRPTMMVLRFEKATLLIYESGSVVINGSTNVSTAISTMNSFCMMTGYKYSSIRSSSRTVVHQLPFKVDLNRLKMMKKFIMYEAEIFPKATFKLNDINCNLFHTGKVVMMGNHTLNEFEICTSLLEQFVPIECHK